VKIVIYGLGKSGTSALFYKIRNSLPPGTIALFEPDRYGRREALRARLGALLRGRFAPDIVAKVLPCGRRAVRLRDFDKFDRQVLIVRDPRDRLVSAVLYRAYHASFATRDEAALEFLDWLRRKEADPGAVSLQRLITAFEALEGSGTSLPAWLESYRTHAVAGSLAFHAERPHLRPFHYENLVDGRFAALEEALGFPLTGSATVPDMLRRVVRTKGYGAWRNWFTPEDVDSLRPLLDPFLDRYYPDADWHLEASPAIDADHGSHYARQLMDERRAMSGLPALPA
jgi:hypothetical protein